MRSFRHVNVRTLKQTCELFEACGTRARVNADGTDLLGVACVL